MGHIVLLLFVWYNVYWCPTHFQYQMMFMLSSGNMPGVTSGAGTAYPSWSPEFTPIVWWYLCCSIFLCGVCRSLFVLFLLAIVLPLYCLSFCYLWFLITTCISSNFFSWPLYCLSFCYLWFMITTCISSNCFSWPLYCHCIAFHFVIYGFWLPLVYHQTFSLGHCIAFVLPFILLFMVSDYHLYIIKLFLLAIVLPFILLFMVSDYHLYIIKLLLTCAELNLF